MNKPSEFKQWFIKQYGNRPSKKSWLHLRDDLIAAEQDLLNARLAYSECERWDNKYEDAFSAWCIGRSQTKKEKP